MSPRSSICPHPPHVMEKEEETVPARSEQPTKPNKTSQPIRQTNQAKEKLSRAVAQHGQQQRKPNNQTCLQEAKLNLSQLLPDPPHTSNKKKNLQ